MLIGILVCNFCGEFSNRHGSRAPSISPQERSLPSRPKGSWCWQEEALSPLQWWCTGPWLLGLALGSHEEWNKTHFAVDCSQAGVSSWPWRVRDIWGQWWGQLHGHSILPLDNLWQGKSVSSLKKEGKTRTSWCVDLSCLPTLHQVLAFRNQTVSLAITLCLLSHIWLSVYFL